MAGLRISQLDAAGSITGSEMLPVVQGGETVRTTVALAADARITAQKGFANGLAPLDGSSKISTSYLPASVLGAANYQGTWNATTNSPALADGTGTKGFYYVVGTAGSTTIDGINSWALGDWIIFNGTVWEKVDNTDSVLSVNGQTGAVVISTTNVSEGDNLYLTTERVQDIVGVMFNNGGGATWSYDDDTGKIAVAIEIGLANVSDAGSMAGEDAADYYTDNEVDTLLGGYDTKLVTINNQVNDYTLALVDSGAYVRMNKATAVELEVPLNATVAIPVGAKVYVRQVGAGQLTIAAEDGVTINTPETLLLAKQGAACTLIKVATNEWDLEGNLEPA